MSVNFDKHRQKIISAWKDVIDDKSSTDWALFGYEGQTNDLKVVGTGDGGLEELTDDLNSGKIMYAFVRISDSKTGLTKFLLINWQGEGAPVLRKGTCANHIHDVAKVLPGAHLTIYARGEDDVEQDRILQKLSNVSGSISVKEPRLEQDVQKTPIGTNYNRVIPAKELNPVEMQKFWKKEEEEERHRIELEKERKRQELIKQEEEQRSREERAHREREQLTTTKLQPAHVPIKTSPQPLSPIKTLDSPTRMMTEAEKMRQQRNQEARDLIGTRVGTAKAIFTQNSADGQMQTKTSAPIKPVRNSISQRINALNSAQESEVSISPTPTSPVSMPAVEEIVTSSPEPVSVVENLNVADASSGDVSSSNSNSSQQNNSDFAENEEQFSTIKRSPHSKANSLASPDEATTEQTVISPTVLFTSEEPLYMNGKNDEVPSADDIIYQDVLSDGGLKAKALYDYQAADESEITFDPGDIITHIDQIDEGWWQGLGPDGTYGLFPANYVELIN